MDSRYAQNLKPADMVALLRSRGRDAFSDEVGTSILLVRLDDPSSDFALMLEAALEDATTAKGQRPEPTMGFDTVVGSLADAAKGLSALRARAAFTPVDLQRRIQRTVHFAVPLHKRPGASNVFSDRVSVGRARTNDVVLRHHSVSKFHAWFERDENDRFYLCDAKSTNATLVNGVQISKSSPVMVEPGDEVRFGDITAVVCTPELLWDALVAGPPVSSRAPPSSTRTPPPPPPSGRVPPSGRRGS